MFPSQITRSNERVNDISAFKLKKVPFILLISFNYLVANVILKTCLRGSSFNHWKRIVPMPAIFFIPRFGTRLFSEPLAYRADCRMKPRPSPSLRHAFSVRDLSLNLRHFLVVHYYVSKKHTISLGFTIPLSSCEELWCKFLKCWLHRVCPPPPGTGN